MSKPIMFWCNTWLDKKSFNVPSTNCCKACHNNVNSAFLPTRTINGQTYVVCCEIAKICTNVRKK